MSHAANALRNSFICHRLYAPSSTHTSSVWSSRLAYNSALIPMHRALEHHQPKVPGVTYGGAVWARVGMHAHVRLADTNVRGAAMLFVPVF
jgi:hypothetical protein